MNNDSIRILKYNAIKVTFVLVVHVIHGVRGHEMLPRYTSCSLHTIQGNLKQTNVVSFALAIPL